MDFDLKAQNAITNQEYADESMLLPPGKNLFVHRLPAPKGEGFKFRMTSGSKRTLPAQKMPRKGRRINNKEDENDFSQRILIRADDLQYFQSCPPAARDSCAPSTISTAHISSINQIRPITAKVYDNLASNNALRFTLPVTKLNLPGHRWLCMHAEYRRRRRRQLQQQRNAN